MRKASFTILALSVASLWSAALVVAETSRGLGGGSSGRDCWVTGTECRPAPAPRSAWPTFTRVAATGVTIVVPDDHATIQAAIDAAAPGDTVYVRAGTYFEHLVLNEQLTLRGEDAATTIIDGGGSGNVLHVTASGVRIQGFSIQNSGPGSYEWPDAGVILSSVQDVHVAHCRFTSNDIAVYACNVAYSVFEKSLFAANQAGIVTEQDYSDPGYAGWFHANRILNNVFTANGHAIGFTHIMENDCNVVQGNFIADNSVGISITVSDVNEFSYNTFVNNSSYAFLLGICECGAVHNHIHHNNFINNHGGGVQAYESWTDPFAGPNYWYSIYDGVGNFWSDYEGGDGDQDGLGDSPYVIPDGQDGDLHPLMHRFLPGDMNLDGVLNSFDIDPFVLGLTDAAAYQAQFMQPPALLGDCNLDGLLNAFDIDAFVYRLTHADELPIPPNRPPTAPAEPNPPEGAVGIGAPFLNWTAADPDVADSMVYDVYFDAGGAPPATLVSVGQSEDWWCIGALQPGMTYYWQIVARDNHGAETPGPIWSFTAGDSVWMFETAATGVSHAPCPSLVLDSQGGPHLSFLHSPSALVYAGRSESGWEEQIVAASGAGHPTCVLDGSDTPHLSYSCDGVQYTQWTGSAWASEALDASGGLPAIALDSQGYPHVAYYDYTRPSRVEYASWTGSAWSIETVGALSCRDVALAMDASDAPHILIQSSDLSYAYRSGTSWIVETVYPCGGSCSGAALALDSSGRPHASFLHGGQLKYASRTGASWAIETVAPALSNWDSSLQLDSLDHPHIAYCAYESFRVALTYAVWTGTEWHTELVDLSGAGNYLALALDADRQPLLVYASNSELKFAHKSGPRK